MIGYTTVGASDLKKSGEFYDKVFATVGAKRVMDFDTFTVWNTSEGGAGFSITSPFNKEAPTVGNGVMMAISAPDRATVDKMHATALAEGGTCEGKPGLRSEVSGFYAAYFRDLDGNKLNAFHMKSAS